MTKLYDAKVIVFGIGGVGSWAVETLVRSGIGNITIVDADVVCTSNINRQLPALESTVGKSKVEVMKARLKDINPSCNIIAIERRFCLEDSSEFNLEEYDYIVDAIDSLTDKANLMIVSTAMKIPIASSMGAAQKLDPSRISTAPFEKVRGCRLAAALRSKFKRMGRWPSRRIECVYSDEYIPNRGVAESDTSGVMTYGKVAFNGAAMHITAIFGITLASIVIRKLIGRP